MRALRCHVSQLTDPDGMEQRIRDRFRQIAADRGLPDGTQRRTLPRPRHPLILHPTRRDERNARGSVASLIAG